MSKKVEEIGNQYTSDKIEKATTTKEMRVVRRRVTVFGGILLAIIIILSIMLVVQNKAMIKQQLSVNIKRNSFRKARRGNRIKRRT